MIDKFREEYFFLSNFYEAPVTFEGLTYTNNEAAFQAQKCINPKDRIRFTTMSPSEAKKEGRKVSLRKDWEYIKVSVMSGLLKAKFDQNPDLKEKLLDTDDEYLIEGNTWGDRIWGQVDGQGKNLLGKLLMNLRSDYNLKIEIFDKNNEDIRQDILDFFDEQFSLEFNGEAVFQFYWHEIDREDTNIYRIVFEDFFKSWKSKYYDDFLHIYVDMKNEKITGYEVVSEDGVTHADNIVPEYIQSLTKDLVAIVNDNIKHNRDYYPYDL